MLPSTPSPISIPSTPSSYHFWQSPRRLLLRSPNSSSPQNHATKKHWWLSLFFKGIKGCGMIAFLLLCAGYGRPESPFVMLDEYSSSTTPKILGASYDDGPNGMPNPPPSLRRPTTVPAATTTTTLEEYAHNYINNRPASASPSLDDSTNENADPHGFTSPPPRLSLESQDNADEEPSVDSPLLRPFPSWKTTRQSDSSLSSKDTMALYDARTYSVFDAPLNIRVHLISDTSHAVDPPSKFLLDGLERSAYTKVVGVTFLTPTIKELQVTHFQNDTQSADEDDALLPLVWMVDWGSMNRDCHRLELTLDRLGRDAKTEPLVLMDMSASPRQTTCEWDESSTTTPTTRLVKRTIVRNRHYHESKMDRGSLVQNVGTASGPTLQMHLPLREKFVDVLSDVVVTNETIKKGLSKRRVILDRERDYDVAMFHKEGDYSHYGFWRRDVSNAVRALNSTSCKVWADVAVNDEIGFEEGNIQLNYVTKLLDSKIVVVAQKDEWEDDYRLLESMASGAMVLMDSMVVPLHGLKNKSNVVIYDNREALPQLIQYYLKHDDKRKAIARRGVELSLGRHRSWHRVEEVLYGEPLTHVDKPYDNPPEHEKRDVTVLQEGQEA